MACFGFVSTESRTNRFEPTERSDGKLRRDVVICFIHNVIITINISSHRLIRRTTDRFLVAGVRLSIRISLTVK